MKRILLGFPVCAALALAGAVPARAQSAFGGRLVNAKLETRAAAPSLEAAFRSIVQQQTAPAWVAYAVAAHATDREMCCGSWSGWGYSDQRDCGCRLERDDGFHISRNDERDGVTRSGTVKLEGPAHFFVLLRVESSRVGKILALSEDCEMDAGGLPFIFLTGVPPAESLRLLSPYAISAEEGESKLGKLGQHAVSAIALHADPAADRILENFVAPDQPVGLRRHAAFWLGAERGRRGYEILRRLVKDDPSDKVREHAVFALSISKEPGAVDAMIDVARSDRSTRVRGQALFWLGQKAGQKAVGAISEALEKDPETEVKKKAVFALSQFPRDEGVPLLIQVARTNRNPAVRKQAMFWLGQSKDPRALAFFEEILRN